MDDKKKILILGTLFVLILGIGAFQFVKSGNQAPEAAASTEKKVANTEPAEKPASTGTEADPATETADTKGEKTENGGEAITSVDPALVVAAKLSPRDPFDGRRWDKGDTKAQTPPPTPEAPKVRPVRPPRGISGGGFAPYGVPPIGGVLPEAGGTAPVAGGKMPSIDDFPYSVSGTMLGEKPLVVLTDQAGKQKIVTVGSAIDGDSQVISISNGKVIVRHRGKNKTLPVGGINPSNNKQEGNQ